MTAPAPTPFTPEMRARRLRDFIRIVAPGQCKILSLGDECICPLCDVDGLYKLATPASTEATRRYGHFDDEGTWHESGFPVGLTDAQAQAWHAERRAEDGTDQSAATPSDVHESAIAGDRKAGDGPAADPTRAALVAEIEAIDTKLRHSYWGAVLKRTDNSGYVMGNVSVDLLKALHLAALRARAQIVADGDLQQLANDLDGVIEYAKQAAIQDAERIATLERALLRIGPEDSRAYEIACEVLNT